MLPWAIRNRRFQSVPLLLSAGVDPDVPDTDGETPLHLAIRSTAIDTVEALLKAGANVDARNFDSKTPLEFALEVQDDAIRERLTKQLLGAGASAFSLVVR